jgi:hypothetical protein
VDLRALYGGRHLRTTVAVAATGIAAGAVTGAIGLGVASTQAAHVNGTTVRHTVAPKHHRHPRPAPQMTFVFSHRPTPAATTTKASPSRTPTTKPATSAPAATSASTAPAATASSAPASSGGGGQSPPSG